MSLRDHLWESFDDLPFHRLLGIRRVEQRPGYGKIRLDRTPNTPTGIGGSVHGGVLATMADVVMLLAVFSDLRDDHEPAGTADLNLTYLRQARGDSITAEATVLKRGRQLAVVEIGIHDSQGQLCARGRILYAFRPRDPAAGR